MKYKTFVIYTDFHNGSKQIANKCFKSLDTTWNAELFSGCSPYNLHTYEKLYGIKKMQEKYKKINENKIQSKKCCFYSHYHLWNICVQDNLDFIVVLEHDTESIASLPLKHIKKFLKNKKCIGIQITTESMLKNLSKYQKYIDDYNSYEKGIHEIFYVHAFGKKFFAGGTGYILDYEACRYLLAEVKNKGWYQNDIMFSTEEDFPLYFIKPDLCLYNPERELNTSSSKI